MRAKYGVLEQTRDLRYMPNFVAIGLFSRPMAAKNPKFCLFWISAFSAVANWHQAQKVEHGCTTTNLPLSNGVKIVSVLQRLHGEIGRPNSDVQKRDRQTNKQTHKQTKKSTSLATPAAGEIQTKEGRQGGEVEGLYA